MGKVKKSKESCCIRHNFVVDVSFQLFLGVGDTLMGFRNPYIDSLMLIVEIKTEHKLL